MNKSESIKNLAAALCKVQSKLKPAVKDAKNPFFKSSYADLNSVWNSCRELLAENGLSVVQTNEPITDGVIVETVLMHESGEWISGSLLLPLNKLDSQAVGSAITYGRRYGLSSMIGIIADEDDDGNAASSTAVEARKAQTRETAQKPYEPKPIQKDDELELKKLRGEAKTLVETKCIDEVQEKSLLKGRQIDMMDVSALKKFIDEAKAF